MARKYTEEDAARDTAVSVETVKGAWNLARNDAQKSGEKDKKKEEKKKTEKGSH